MADGYANLGSTGVNLVNEGYSPEDGSVDNAQNAELLFDAEKGGESSLAKRGGYTPLGSVFGSGVVEMVQIRFIAGL